MSTLVVTNLSLGAGGLPNGSVLTDDIADAAITSAKVASAAVTAAKLDGNQSGSAPIYGARAWVNFDGTGTIAIRESGNVSSLTDVSTGRYSVNFAQAFPNASYCTVVTAGSSTAGAAYLDARISGAPSTSAVTVSSHIQNSGNPTYSDVNQMNVIIMD